MNTQQPEDGGPAFPCPSQAETPVNLHEGMTLRQYAAIKLKVPNSGTDWLDEMIRQSLRDEFAAKAMQGWMATYSPEQPYATVDATEVAKLSYRIADAMLKARGEKQPPLN